MKFEGEHKIIPVKGIARAGADSLCDDGAMNEVIGLEYKDGSYVPYAGKVTSAQMVSGTTLLRVHKTSTGNNVVARFNGGLWWIEESKFNNGEAADAGSWTLIYESDKIKNVTNIKNILMLEIEGTEVLYYRFTGVKYEEIKIKDMADDLPIMKLYVTNDVDIKVNNKTNGPLLCVKDNGNPNSDSLKRAYNVGISKLNELGRLHGYVLALYAYKLVSGEYVYASTPILLCPPNNAVGKDTDNYPDKYDKTMYYTTQFVGTYGDNNLLTYISEEDYKEAFEYGDTASASAYAKLFERYGSNETAKLKSDVNATKYMPPLWGGMMLATGGSSGVSRLPFLTMASNALKCKITSTIEQGYKGLIESCCVFLSEQIPLYEMDDDNIHQTENFYPVNGSGTHLGGAGVVGYYFDKRSDEDIRKDIKNIRNFYLVDEIPFDKILEGTIDVNLEGKLGDNLAVQESLPISAFSNTQVFNGSSFVYNSRHHLYSYTEEKIYGCKLDTAKLIGGHGQLSYEGGDGKYRVIAHIKSVTDGDCTVVSDEFNIDSSYFNGYFIYPDSSADTVYLLNVNTNMACKFAMTPSKHGGYAYNLVDLDKLNFAEHARTKLDEYSSENVLIDCSNRIKVSDAYFAYTFPLENTNVIGNGNIIGLARLSISMSNDSFGSYPLLVFTTEGIYSMEVDKTGSGAYASTPPPFSREVCINKNTICELDGAVLFASSKGLMIATAQGVQEFLPTLNGEPRHLPQDDKSTKGLGLKLYKDTINNSLSVQLTSCISQDDFIEYLSDSNTFITYASEKNNVIVYNGTKPYCYWIDIPTRNVTKLPVGIKMDNDNYPTELYVTNGNQIIEFRHLSADGDVQCMFQSRPIKVDGGLKSHIRVVTRGYFNSEDADKYAVLLVLGSYDGMHWQPIGAKQKKFSGGFHDLGCVVDRVSCEYIMVIVSGSLSPDSHIDGIELTKINKYNNKLR